MNHDPLGRFRAQPPRPVPASGLTKHLLLFVKSFAYFLWQIVIPFHTQPEPIADFPDSAVDGGVNESTVKECQWIFDQTEQRRNSLEQKAQSTFGLMVFLVPLITSAFLYILSKSVPGKLRATVLVLLLIAGVFLLLGFVSALRAVGVKASQTLTAGAVLKENGTFRRYEAAFHAKGLLYCASMNTATNDHLAQFVRGAHAMTGTAILIVLLACIPESKAALQTTRNHQDPTEVKVTGPVEVLSKGISAMPPCSPHAAEAAPPERAAQPAKEPSGRVSKEDLPSSKAVQKP